MYVLRLLGNGGGGARLVAKRFKYTLSFKHDPSRQVLLFYSRDSPPAVMGGKLFRETLEDIYCVSTGKEKLPYRSRKEFPGAIHPFAPIDYRRVDTQALASALERIGRMPRLRQFTVCAISKLFFDHKAYRIRFFDDVTNKVRLRPGFVFEKLLGEAFELDGKMTDQGYRDLRSMVNNECYVRHGIEVDLRYVPGMDQKRFVVFPRKITRKEIRRSLAKAGIGRMRLMRLRIIRPNPRFYDIRMGKRLPTRCLVFPAGTSRTIRRRTRIKPRDRRLPDRPLD